MDGATHDHHGGHGRGHVFHQHSPFVFFYICLKDNAIKGDRCKCKIALDGHEMSFDFNQHLSPLPLHPRADEEW